MHSKSKREHRPIQGLVNVNTVENDAHPQKTTIKNPRSFELNGEMTKWIKKKQKRNIIGFREDKPKDPSSATLSIHKKVKKNKRMHACKEMCQRIRNAKQ